MLPTTKPEHLRRSLRLVLGVTLPCLVGFGVVGPEHLVYSDEIKGACKWAAITAAIVAHPLLGELSQVGTERLVGTVLGGSVGYVVHQLGLHVFGEVTDGIFMSLSAGLLAGLSVIYGKKWKLNTSAKLFVITLLLITFAAETGKDVELFAIARVSGILLGVLIMLLLSVVIFPKSATVESLHNMDDALENILYLIKGVWKQYLSVQDDDLVGHDIETPLMGREEFSARNMENALTEMYESLSKMEDNLQASAAEVLISCTSKNQLVLAPRLTFRADSLSDVKHLPSEDLCDMANAVRRVARGLFTVEKALEDWHDVCDSDVELQEKETAVLRSIGERMRGVVVEIQNQFPMHRSLDSKVLLDMVHSVRNWEDMGVNGRLQSLEKYQRFSSTLRDLERDFSFSMEDSAESSADQSGISDGSSSRTENTAEWSTLTFALTSLAAELGCLWNSCDVVLRRLPFKH
ncbi:hypothetical protein PSENEW3_00001552 [Picochlorum sp. SENEW3]|nr:hypothetical protein PSENEW3_00001552 [Picochlorum sp. SENEW3]